MMKSAWGGEGLLGYGLYDVYHSYNGNKVIKGITIEGNKSEVVCLLGSSGCGKTTTLKVLSGLERQQKGTVKIYNEVVSDANKHLPPRERNVGFLFHDFALFPHMTVLENVMFGIREKDNFLRRHLAMTFLERIRLSSFFDKYPHMLSAGEQQRVALARSIATKPRVMLMDEPFSSLDSRLRDTVRDETLSLLKEEGSSVILVTHEPDEALRMADKLVLMRKGKVVQQGEPYHIYNHPLDLETAEFFSDINVISSTVKFQQADTVFGKFLTPGFNDGDKIDIVFRPQHLMVSIHSGNDEPVNLAMHYGGSSSRGFLERARFMGSHSLLEIRMPHDGSLLLATVPGVCLPVKGESLNLSVKRSDCFVFLKNKGDSCAN